MLMLEVDPLERAIAAVSYEAVALVSVNLKMAMGKEEFKLSLAMPLPVMMGEKHLSAKAS